MSVSGTKRPPNAPKCPFASGRVAEGVDMRNLSQAGWKPVEKSIPERDRGSVAGDRHLGLALRFRLGLLGVERHVSGDEAREEEAPREVAQGARVRRDHLLAAGYRRDFRVVWHVVDVADVLLRLQALPPTCVEHLDRLAVVLLLIVLVDEGDRVDVAPVRDGPLLLALDDAISPLAEPLQVGLAARHIDE